MMERSLQLLRIIRHEALLNAFLHTIMYMTQWGHEWGQKIVLQMENAVKIWKIEIHWKCNRKAPEALSRPLRLVLSGTPGRT